MRLEHRDFDIVSIIRRWLWLVILMTLLSSLVAYVIIRQQPPIYGAATRLVVGPGIDSASPDLNSLRTGGQLMQTYAQLATTRPVLRKIIEDLGLNIGPLELMENLQLTSNEETRILTIVYQDTERARAVAVADQIAETLVRMSASGPESPAFRLNIQLQNTADQLGEEILRIERSIESLESRYAAATEVEDRRLLLDELTKERTRLTDTNRTLVTLYDWLSRASTNQVEIIETAGFGYEVESQARFKILIASMVGLVLSVVITIAFEYFDETIKSVEELGQLTRVPVLGAIAGHRSLRGSGGNRLIVQALPDSRVAEMYRMLGTKLIFSNGHKTGSSRSILLSSGSAQVKEGTGEAAANLAVILAQAGKRVVLVDANLQRSTMTTIAELFNIEDRLGGLTDVLTGQAKSPRLTSVGWAPGLSILPTGPVSYDSFALLSSTRMVELLEELESKADIVIITAPPLLSFADSLVLASRVDGAAIVVHSGKTRPATISEVIKTLRSLDAHIIGTILEEKRMLQLPLLPWIGLAPASATGPIGNEADEELGEGRRRPTAELLETMEAAEQAGQDGDEAPVPAAEQVEPNGQEALLPAVELVEPMGGEAAILATEQAEPNGEEALALAAEQIESGDEEALVLAAEQPGPSSQEAPVLASANPELEITPQPLKEATAADKRQDTPAKHQLVRIRGIGPVYAGRLREEGIDCIADLAEQLPARLAEIVGLPSGQVESKATAWIEEARTLLAASEEVPNSH